MGLPAPLCVSSRAGDTPKPTHSSNSFHVSGQHCGSDSPEGPSGFLERLCFEMKKGYKETMLQLVLSPAHIFISDNYQVSRPQSMGPYLGMHSYRNPPPSLQRVHLFIFTRI